MCSQMRALKNLIIIQVNLDLMSGTIMNDAERARNKSTEKNSRIQLGFKPKTF